MLKSAYIIILITILRGANKRNETISGGIVALKKKNGKKCNGREGSLVTTFDYTYLFDSNKYLRLKKTDRRAMRRQR